MEYPKRLIEVDLPIKRISAHARREKSIRHGHISTLHIWWARRPLAACRAVICASLWPDPVDELCPQAFRDAAAQAMNGFAKAIRESEAVQKIMGEYSGGFLALEKAPLDPKNPDHWNPLRYLLLDFIADFAAWEASTEPHFLDTSRKLTQAAHEALGGAPGTRPLVVDPFAGGGSIPLEALRVGADAFASDLNPVAVLLNKVVLEYIPKYGQRLADEVRKWGQWIKGQAEKELAEYYPRDPDGATPIAYLWARTITCEGPGCGAEVPLMRSLWLAKKASRSIALKMVATEGTDSTKKIDFVIVERRGKEWTIIESPSVPFVPLAAEYDPDKGTVKRGSATCPVCGYTTPVASVRKQLKPRRGGAADARLFCVVTTHPGQQGRFYRLPTQGDLDAVRKAAKELERRKKAYKGDLSLVPDEPAPQAGALSCRNAIYGLDLWGDFFTPRQAMVLATLARLVGEMNIDASLSADKTQGEWDGLDVAVKTCLACTLDREAEHLSSLCRWNCSGQKMQASFGRQALPMVWDYCESNPFGGSVGSWESLLECILIPFETALCVRTPGHVERASAMAHPLPDDAAQCFFTDPPYYDAINYANISDFFYVWLRRTLLSSFPILLCDTLTDKANECVVNPLRDSGAKMYERMMAEAMTEGRRVLTPEGLGLVVFAHKSTSGWETQLQAMVGAGWIVTASWPIDTEMGSRMNAMGTASLASSVHLVCRPRENPDGSLRTDDIGDWRDVLRELPERIHEWLPRLADEGVVGADAIFACLGPALEVFSRYSRVEKASGEVVPLREYLEQVWAAVSKEALTLVFKDADTSGFEEDARLTAMWLWTLGANMDGEDGEDGEEGTVIKSTGYTLEYDAARKIAQGLGCHLEQLATLVEVKGDKATLLPVSQRTKALFGKDAEGPKGGRKKKRSGQMDMFKALDEVESEDGGWTDTTTPSLGKTVLDQIHQTMILFATGRSEAMRRFLVDDGVGHDPRFWGLAQALSALYPPNTDEKRWVDGVLARKKGLGY